MGLAIISSLIIGIIVYVSTFKDDFKTEELEIVTPFIIIAIIIILLFQVLANL